MKSVVQDIKQPWWAPPHSINDMHPEFPVTMSREALYSFRFESNNESWLSLGTLIRLIINIEDELPWEYAEELELATNELEEAQAKVNEIKGWREDTHNEIRRRYG